MSLDKELEGVIAPQVESPDDLTDDADDTVVVSPPDEPKPDTDDKDKSGRTLENVRGELLRKQDESERKLLAQLAQIANTVAAINSSKPAEKSAQTFDDMSLEELKAFRAKVPDERKAEFDEYYADRFVTDRVNTKLTQRLESDKYTKERSKFNQLAVDRFPQLLDPTSPLRLEVNRRLDGLSKEFIQYPRIVLNLAEDVAGELGVTPRVIKGTRQVPQPSSVRRGEKPSSAETVSVMSDAEYEKIAARYKHAKKGGFDKKRIMQRRAEYEKFNQGQE